MTGKKHSAFLVYLPVVWLLLGCGLEEYPNVLPVPQSNITQYSNDRATVRLPAVNTDYSPTTQFVIFYKIYISDHSELSTTFSDSSVYTTINQTLASDFTGIRQYIDSETLVNVNMDAQFQQRSYRYLGLEAPYEIDSVLAGDAAQGKTIYFEFASAGAQPFMRIDSVEYPLLRSNGNGTFSPLPAHRLFLNTPELWNSANINSQVNADVVNKSGIGASGTHYAYAAMFIAAVGIDPTTYSNIYSTPALIHVFELPNR